MIEPVTVELKLHRLSHAHEGLGHCNRPSGAGRCLAELVLANLAGLCGIYVDCSGGVCDGLQSAVFCPSWSFGWSTRWLWRYTIWPTSSTPKWDLLNLRPQQKNTQICVIHLIWHPSFEPRSCFRHLRQRIGMFVLGTAAIPPRPLVVSASSEATRAEFGPIRLGPVGHWLCNKHHGFFWWFDIGTLVPSTLWEWRCVHDEKWRLPKQRLSHCRFGAATPLEDRGKWFV